MVDPRLNSVHLEAPRRQEFRRAREVLLNARGWQTLAGEGGPVTFTRTGVEAETDSTTTLLAAGEKAGVLMPSGCRMGVCFGCVVPLRNGAVRDIRVRKLGDVRGRSRSCVFGSG